MKREHILQQQSPLPSGYRQLEYLESTGTQYIQLNFDNTLDNRYIIDFKVDRASFWAFGSVESAGSHLDCGVAVSAIRFAQRYATGFNFSYTRHTIEVDKAGYSVDGTRVNWSSPATSASSLGNIRLFCANRSSLTPFGRIYKFELYSYTSGNLTMQLSPALRTSDSKPGLYDIVNNQFYTNAGTGEFLYN